MVRRAKEEILQGTRPDLLPPLPDLKPYDRVYVGTPIWCGTMAPPLASFLALQTWEGKRVFPFCTHGGGGKGRCEQDIRALCAWAPRWRRCSARGRATPAAALQALKAWGAASGREG